LKKQILSSNDTGTSIEALDSMSNKNSFSVI